MVLLNIRIEGSDEVSHIHIRDGMINAVLRNGPDAAALNDPLIIDCSGAAAFPGFINSHDHLDFNLFPPLANRLYADYTEWGTDIQQSGKDVIKKVLTVPEPLRVQWGVYKNMLNGFTTVINHGKKVQAGKDLIETDQRSQCLHSTAFEKWWKLKLNNPFRICQTVVMHAGEGISERAKEEVNEIKKINLLKRKIVAVHGVAMDKMQAAAFAGVVWCPASNDFLFRETADIASLRNVTEVVLGTDSTLTSSWSIWDHLCIAKRYSHFSDEILTAMLTSAPASLWGYKTKGQLKAGFDADIVILEKRKFDECDAGSILLLLRKGKLLIADEVLCEQAAVKNLINNGYQGISIQNRIKQTKGDLPALKKEIKKYYPEAFFPFD